jgi:hypothetical protein
MRMREACVAVIGMHMRIVVESGARRLTIVRGRLRTFAPVLALRAWTRLKEGGHLRVVVTDGAVGVRRGIQARLDVVARLRSQRQET